MHFLKKITPSSRKIRVAAVCGLLFFLIWWFSLPEKLFEDPFSTVLEDKDGQLLSAAISADGQWRFPEGSSVPGSYARALIAFEDGRFEHHPGVDLFSLCRAMRDNLKAGHIVSGGSTLSMQLIRLSRKGHERTVVEKLIEIFLATRLEFRYSKKEIIALYAAHAPFGGNVVGIESACWRYFSRNPSSLSWAESALLAVLPNNPSAIHPGKNRIALKRRRDKLLTKLKNQGKIDQLTLTLALAEEIPENPTPLPRYARHLLSRVSIEGAGQTRVNLTLDISLQRQAELILDRHYERLRGNQVFNAAALIVDVRTGNVLAYAGNTNAGAENQEDVDIVMAPRSTGSILKPFLFAAALDEGKILPKTLLPDVPVIINGFSPHNFSHEYDGAVAADKALIRSLNVPMVHLLREYRYEKFYGLLKHVGLTTLNSPADHYGLSLILGGAEGSLWDITGAYASMARVLNNYSTHPGMDRYDPQDIHPLHYRRSEGNENSPQVLSANSFLSAASLWTTLEALKEVYRPGEETGWRFFSSSKKIAWKTGTSFGFRDGWAIGVNPDYAVGVWTGNADGEGRPGLTGTDSAAPVLFDLFSILPGQKWFQQPKDEMAQIEVCSLSGQRASDLCGGKMMSWVTSSGLVAPLCQYHRQVHLTEDEKYRVHSLCEPVAKMKNVGWFVLPPVQEYYFKSKNLTYRSLPPFRSDCADPSVIAGMDLVYPRPDARIFVPHDLDGKPGEVIFEAAHRMSATHIFWHLDGNFVGTTQKRHQLALFPPKGDHILTLIADDGEIIQRKFSVLSSR